MDQFKSSKSETSGLASGRRVYQWVRAQIEEGLLQGGMRLPSTRALAAELGISRTTVSAAFDQLAAEGFVVTSAGRAARVSAQSSGAKISARPAVRRHRTLPTVSELARRIGSMELPTLASGAAVSVDFLYGAVSSADFPATAWRRAYLAELGHPQGDLYYAPPEGDAGLRRELQGYLRRARGVQCDVEQILIVHGAQQAIDLCARLLLNPGDAFVFEEPGYLMARRSFEATGARLLTVPVDDLGLDTAGLSSATDVRLAYVTPSHQFPLGGVLPIARRAELLHWARQRGAWIIEDDYDGEFRYGQRPIDALQASEPNGRVLYVGTFSKALSPQLRLGYIVLPHELVHVFKQAKRLADRHTPMLEQRILAGLLGSGTYERHIRRVRRAHERRRAALLEAITRHLPKDAEVVGTSAGLHIVIYLPQLRSSDEPSLVTAARKGGVGVYPLTPLYAHPNANRCAGLVLGYASLNAEQIGQGVRILASAIATVKRRN